MPLPNEIWLAYCKPLHTWKLQAAVGLALLAGPVLRGEGFVDSGLCVAPSMSGASQKHAVLFFAVQRMPSDFAKDDLWQGSGHHPPLLRLVPRVCGVEPMVCTCGLAEECFFFFLQQDDTWVCLFVGGYSFLVVVKGRQQSTHHFGLR